MQPDADPTPSGPTDKPALSACELGVRPRLSVSLMTVFGLTAIIAAGLVVVRWNRVLGIGLFVLGIPTLVDTFLTIRLWSAHDHPPGWRDVLRAVGKSAIAVGFLALLSTPAAGAVGVFMEVVRTSRQAPRTPASHDWETIAMCTVEGALVMFEVVVIYVHRLRKARRPGRRRRFLFEEQAGD
jgi:hypothetical protein